MCDKCGIYKKEADKYKKKYELAKSSLTQEERNAILELICNEQIKYYLVKNEYDSARYKCLEELKMKIKIV